MKIITLDSYVFRDTGGLTVESWLKLHLLQITVRQAVVITCYYYYYFSLSSAETDFNVDSVLFELQKAKFPSHKWKLLANGLRVASLVPNIEASCRDLASMLQELIYRWVGSTTGNQWVMLIAMLS